MAVPGGAGYDITQGETSGSRHREDAPGFGKLVAMPSIDAFFDPEPRLELMKEMGIDRTLLWPTLASVLEERMANDPDAVCAVIHALNEWMHEHWTFVYSDAIYSTPIISLAAGNDVALEELEWIAERGREDLPDPRRAGAHVEGPQVVRAARVRPVLGARAGARPRRRHALGRPRLHPLHERVGGTRRRRDHDHRQVEEQAGVVAGVPRSCRRRRTTSSTRWRRSSATGSPRGSPSSSSCRSSSPSAWIRPFYAKMQRAWDDAPVLFDENPVDVFNRNVWVHAFHEPDPKGLIDLGIPVDHIMFGSDFPHPEGMADPLAYSAVVADLPLDQQALIMGGSLEKAIRVGQVRAEPHDRLSDESSSTRCRPTTSNRARR